MAEPDRLLIRRVNRCDFDAWLPLWTNYNTFYRRAVDRAVTDMTWQRFFDSYEPVYANVAEIDGQLVGLVHYIFHRNTGMLGPVCYLQDLFTNEQIRGRGVGRALIGAVYVAAAEAGSERVYWLTHESNSQAMTLYDKVATRSGFVQYRKQIGPS